MISGLVDGVASEDMDLFLYGCPKVYRYLSLANSTLILYNTENILQILNCTIEEFKLICILSGTDYYNFDVGNLPYNAVGLFLKSSFCILNFTAILTYVLRINII